MQLIMAVRLPCLFARLVYYGRHFLVAITFAKECGWLEISDANRWISDHKNAEDYIPMRL
jgi:hypothetical protein